MALVFDALREANICLDEKDNERAKVLYLTIVELMSILGIDLAETNSNESDVDSAKVEELIFQRKVAREEKDFARADEIRDELSSLGITIEDGPKGTTWHVETKTK